MQLFTFNFGVIIYLIFHKLPSNCINDHWHFKINFQAFW